MKFLAKLWARITAPKGMTRVLDIQGGDDILLSFSGVTIMEAQRAMDSLHKQLSYRQPSHQCRIVFMALPNVHAKVDITVLRHANDALKACCNEQQT